MKYEICYIDKTNRKKFQQHLDTFSEFQEFRKRYAELYQNQGAFYIDGVSVYRSHKDELHEIILINKEKKSLLMYKSTKDGIEDLMSLLLGAHLKVLDSSLYYDDWDESPEDK
nr:MAG TPA: hypothetical protein [Caudoviricetes sp.]